MEIIILILLFLVPAYLGSMAFNDEPALGALAGMFGPMTIFYFATKYINTIVGITLSVTFIVWMIYRILNKPYSEIAGSGREWGRGDGGDGGGG